MNPSEQNPDAADRVAQYLRQAAETERAPESLRAAVRLQEREAREGGKQPAPVRSARRGISGSRSRPSLKLGPELAAAVSVAPAPDDDMTQSKLRRKRRMQLRTFALPAALVLIVMIVGVVRAGGGSSQQPTVKQVAHLAALSPSDPAPKPDPTASRTKLTASVTGLHFPNWAVYSGWAASGLRQDELQGRHVTTVFYKRDGQQVAYSIVAPPEIASVGKAANSHQSFHYAGRTYVIWTASGHTCMLSGTDTSAHKLWDLAQSTDPA
jgi:hypothetical protein